MFKKTMVIGVLACIVSQWGYASTDTNTVAVGLETLFQKNERMHTQMYCTPPQVFVPLVQSHLQRLSGSCVDCPASRPYDPTTNSCAEPTQ